MNGEEALIAENQCSAQFQSHFPRLENQDMPLW